MAETKAAAAGKTPEPAAPAPEAASAAAPDAGGSDDLFAAAKAKAPNLTKEFVAEYNLDDDVLAGIARGEIPPPPTVGPEHTSDLHFTPGGWQSTPPGVKPEDVGKDAISR